MVELTSPVQQVVHCHLANNYIYFRDFLGGFFFSLIWDVSFSAWLWKRKQMCHVTVMMNLFHLSQKNNCFEFIKYQKYCTISK